MSKILALDLGDQWVGVAITDASRFFARPFETVTLVELEPYLFILWDERLSSKRAETRQNLIELYTLDSIKVSKCLLITIETIFKKFDISLKDLSFLGAHIGPAPYTTLRVVLATLNGINFAAGTPLIGVNGLTAFLKYLDNTQTNIVLLNAFGNDLYYGISSVKNPSYTLGSENVDKLLHNIAQDISGDINFWGNGSILYKK
ncbi:unnamed protein product [Didymodactylos carnosus]|uniref:Gcp-like domain-containing protein n=1 Tax=Didymodactylos carnosus TaxID=1234261 RepID=A0A816ACE8_9BILA|nr:unnamed protein product [Didymodactylos carnosus]CAF4467823.1 unnamed protein product [Didymodactylos carnosus]